jgi:hypothetical protein
MLVSHGGCRHIQGEGRHITHHSILPTTLDLSLTVLCPRDLIWARLDVDQLSDKHYARTENPEETVLDGSEPA